MVVVRVNTVNTRVGVIARVVVTVGVGVGVGVGV